MLLRLMFLMPLLALLPELLWWLFVLLLLPMLMLPFLLKPQLRL